MSPGPKAASPPKRRKRPRGNHGRSPRAAPKVVVAAADCHKSQFHFRIFQCWTKLNDFYGNTSIVSIVVLCDLAWNLCFIKFRGFKCSLVNFASQRLCARKVERYTVAPLLRVVSILAQGLGVSLFKTLKSMKHASSKRMVLLLMEETLHQLIWQISHYTQGFNTIPGGARFLPSTVGKDSRITMANKDLCWLDMHKNNKDPGDFVDSFSRQWGKHFT